MHGFNLAVSSMQPGEKAIFTIPSALTMTKAGSPASIPSNIPPNQTLRFEIELIAMFTIIDIFKDEGILKKIVKNAEPDRKQSHSSDFVFGTFLIYQFQLYMEIDFFISSIFLLLFTFL